MSADNHSPTVFCHTSLGFYPIVCSNAADQHIPWGLLMRVSKRIVIAVFILSLFFYAVQAVIWVHSTTYAHNETDKQIIEESHPPSYTPAILASGLLVIAAALASIPAKRRP